MKLCPQRVRQAGASNARAAGLIIAAALVIFNGTLLAWLRPSFLTAAPANSAQIKTLSFAGSRLRQ